MRRLPHVLAATVCVLLVVALFGCHGTHRRVDRMGSITRITAPNRVVLPANWAALAVHAARARLESCAQMRSLAPAGCPQGVSLRGRTPGTLESVHWTLAGRPLADAVATPTFTHGVVEVAGTYTMYLSYTTSVRRRHTDVAFSGGVTHASMRWNGTAFERVEFNVFDIPSRHDDRRPLVV